MSDLASLSQELFGRRMRLAVARFTLEKEDGLVYQLEIADALGEKPTYVQQELDRLTRLGMIVEMPRSGDSRRRYFLRNESPLWKVIEAAVAATTDSVLDGDK